MNRIFIVVMFASSFALADTYVKTNKKAQFNETQKKEKSYFDSMRSVPTVNAEGRKPMLQPLYLNNDKKKEMEQQIKTIQKNNPNKGLLIDAKTGKVVGTVPLSQQKELPKKLSRFQAYTKQSNIQPVPPKVSIAPYQMQEERIDLHR